ncbi:hypothetical protein ACIGO9_19345 [Nocardia asteroides]|uniref:hypothetical protein n=1 Tax=Nocardia asteroides TaxID=1824 RepID=UPI0037CAFD8F
MLEAFQDLAIRQWHVRPAESVDEVRQWILSWRSAWSTGNGQWTVTSDGEVTGRIVDPVSLMAGYLGWRGSSG